MTTPEFSLVDFATLWLDHLKSSKFEPEKL